jgi:hypothetical protein
MLVGDDAALAVAVAVAVAVATGAAVAATAVAAADADAEAAGEDDANDFAATGTPPVLDPPLHAAIVVEAHSAAKNFTRGNSRAKSNSRISSQTQGIA